MTTDPQTAWTADWLAGFVLVMLHRLMAALAYHLNWFGPLVKGHPVLLVEDGQADPAALRDAHISGVRPPTANGTARSA